MRTIFSLITSWIFVVCLNHLTCLNATDVDNCRDVPISLPSIRLLSIPKFVLGQPGLVLLKLGSTYPLEFLWYKNILKDRKSYPAIISAGDSKFTVTYNRPSRNEYEARLQVKEISADDLKFNRFTLEITIRHPCVSLQMKMLLGSNDIRLRNLKSPVSIQSISKGMLKKNIGDSLQLTFKATYKARPDERLYGVPLSVSKWYSTVSRNGIRNRLKLHAYDNKIPLNANGVVSDVKKVQEGVFEAESLMTLEPLLQSNQGFFQSRLTYDLGRDVFIHLYAQTEFRYSDRLNPAVTVMPCSGLPNRLKNMKIRHGAVQVPVRKGMENCIECYAHAVPDFMMVYASINADFRSGIRFMQPIAKMNYGSLKRYIYPLAAADEGTRHFVCTAGRKDAVTPVPIEVVIYEPVKMTEVSPNELNLAVSNKVIFTCRATGTPQPTITFYRTPKNGILPEDARPEDRQWIEMETGTGVEVMTSHDSVSKVTTGIMVVENVGDDTNSGDFDYTCVVQNDYSRKTGTVFVDAFSRQFDPMLGGVR